MQTHPASGLSEHFKSLADPRVDRTKLHSLHDLLIIAIAAMLCGAESFEDMEDFGTAKEDWFKTFLDLPHAYLLTTHSIGYSARWIPKVFWNASCRGRRACVWRWVKRSSLWMARRCAGPAAKRKRHAAWSAHGRPAMAWCWVKSKCLTNPTKSLPCHSYYAHWNWRAVS